jgi:hypothetical protein
MRSRKMKDDQDEHLLSMVKYLVVLSLESMIVSENRSERTVPCLLRHRLGGILRSENRVGVEPRGYCNLLRSLYLG